MTFYPKLMQATASERQQLLALPVVRQAQIGESNREQYLRFLTNAYHHVKHTVPLLMACGSRLSSAQQWLQSAVAEYIEEEIGHEQWILNDIDAVGGDRQQVVSSDPDYAVEMLVAYAYDSIHRHNPLGFFGMVLVLEGTSVALATAVADMVQKKLSLPNQAFSYLRSHGDLDIEHVGFFERLMNRVKDSSDRQAIIYFAKRFYPLYGAVLSAAYEVKK